MLQTYSPVKVLTMEYSKHELFRKIFKNFYSKGKGVGSPEGMEGLGRWLDSRTHSFIFNWLEAYSTGMVRP